MAQPPRNYGELRETQRQVDEGKTTSSPAQTPEQASQLEPEPANEMDLIQARRDAYTELLQAKAQRGTIPGYEVGNQLNNFDSGNHEAVKEAQQALELKMEAKAVAEEAKMHAQLNKDRENERE